jgi:magnesium transporter
MALEHDLAMRVLVSHPLEAAQALERLAADETARFLAMAEPITGAACLRSMHVPAAAEVLGALEATRAAKVVEELPVDVAAACLRRLEAAPREQLLAQLGGRQQRALRSLLRFTPHTAGSLMDPDVLALPADLTAADATGRVREAAREARYNVYVVDRDQRLTGVFNLRELLLAEPQALLSSIARPNPYRLPASADRRAIVSHPGWREVHALPVVDPDGLYLGAIRYRTLHRLEEELGGSGAETGATARALGELFRTGAGAVLEAVATSAPARRSDAS